MKLVLVRHCATKENLEKRFIGITDVSLAPEGFAHATELSDKMPQVQHLYISPLIRCRQTAILLWPNVGQTVIPELRETDFGPFEGKTHDELKDDEAYNKWLSYPDDPSVVPMVEDVAASGKRATQALEQISADASKNGYEAVGVVSHGGTLMSILARHGQPSRDYYSWRMPNGGGYIARLEQDELLLHVEDKLFE